jgi:predicted MFS family arabinose efflux permease
MEHGRTRLTARFPSGAAALPSPGAAGSGRPHLAALFVTLFLLMVAGFATRQVVVPLFPALREAWNLSDTALAGLVSIVSFMVAACAFPLSMLADRSGHVRAIVAMVVLWSGATLACAWADSYGAMMALRALVGVGAAAFGAVATALLATRFPARVRGTVIAGFLAAGLIGNAAGLALGSEVNAAWGWRAAFVAAALPGLALVAVFVALERGSKSTTPSAGANPVALVPHLCALLRSHTVALSCIAAGLQLATLAAIASWLPLYLERHLGYAPPQAGRLASLVLLLGLAGAVAGGLASDVASARRPFARALVPAAVAAATGILAIATFAFVAPGKAQIACLLGVGLLLPGCIGPTGALVVDVVHPAVRATAASLLALAQNLLGLAGGPLLAGALSDAWGLDRALAIVPLASLVAAALYLLVARTYWVERTRVEKADAAMGALARGESIAPRPPQPSP